MKARPSLGRFTVLLLIPLAIAACGPRGTAAPAAPATSQLDQNPPAPTATASPTLTPSPSPTLSPTATSSPTATLPPAQSGGGSGGLPGLPGGGPDLPDQPSGGSGQPPPPPPPVTLPPPPLPSVRSSGTDGICNPGYSCEPTFSDLWLLSIVIRKDGKELGEADGLDSVEFTVKTPDDLGNCVEPVYYSNTIETKDEPNPEYCIFGRNGSCNTWALGDGVYKWPGGDAVKTGDYCVVINPVVDLDELDPPVAYWAEHFDITVPEIPLQ